MSLRASLRKLLHRSVLACGFRLVRAAPFERALRRWELDRDDFYLLQVGAHNGVTSDPMHRFVSEGHWDCLLVEPQRPSFEVLQTIYAGMDRVKTVQSAVGPQPGTLTLYRIRDDAIGVPHWANQLASVRRDVIASHADRIPGLESLIIEEAVACQTLRSLFDASGFPRLDLLATDVEGYDWEIVQQIDSLPMRPPFIYYEHLHLGTERYRESLAFLAKRGYRCHAVNNGDTFAELRS
jgi:FkbM family methyltransferase